MNESVIKALEAALAANPDDVEIALHLAELYASAERASDALALYRKVLESDPVSAAGLRGAALAAKAAGENKAAAGYRALFESLGLDFDAHSLPDVSLKDVADVVQLPGADVGASAAQASPARVRGAPLKLVASDADDADIDVEFEDSHIYLDDVGGMEAVKKRLHVTFLAPLANPELMQAYGKNVGGGLLLYGPPGCGKTFIAKALAGELGAKFMSVGISDVLDMYIGESERKLHELFEAARRAAPAVLFFDELDALGQKRSQLRNSGVRSLVNQLLAELDSIQSDNQSLFVLAATNHPWDVDSALRRPGRFDRMLAVFPPDLEARKAILAYHLRNRPADKVSVDQIAQHTEHYSGADLAHLCETAVEYVLEEAIESGQARALRTEDFRDPMSEVKPSTRAWFANARNYAMFANDGGAYDDLLHYMNKFKL